MEKSQEDQEQKMKRLDGAQRKEMKDSGWDWGGSSAGGGGAVKAAGRGGQTNAAEGWRVEVTQTDRVTACFVLRVDLALSC